MGRDSAERATPAPGQRDQRQIDQEFAEIFAHGLSDISPPRASRRSAGAANLVMAILATGLLEGERHYWHDQLCHADRGYCHRGQCRLWSSVVALMRRRRRRLAIKSALFLLLTMMTALVIAALASIVWSD